MFFRYRHRSVSVEMQNLRILATEIFKDSKGTARDVFGNILISVPPENFSLHYQSGFQLNPGNRSVFNGTKTIALVGPKIWDLVFLEIKQIKYVNVFRNIGTMYFF